VNSPMARAVVNLPLHVSSLSPTHRDLARRYISNALADESRRSVRKANPHFSTLIASPSGAALLREAGFMPIADRYVVDTTADASLRRVLSALDATPTDGEADAPTLLSLPDELLLRTLVGMSPPDLCRFGRACKAAGHIAGQGCLWLRHCHPRFWPEGFGADRLGADSWLALAPIGVASRAMRVGAAAPGRRHHDRPLRHDDGAALAPRQAGETSSGGQRRSSQPAPRPAQLVDWKRVFMLSRLWGRVHASCAPGVRASLRAGLPLSALQHAPTAAAFRALPPDVAASLLVHDGQFGTSQWGLGLFFGGARLLSLEELSAQLCGGWRGDGALLSLTDTSGFQTLGCAPDGSIWLVSGFNEHRKSASWAEFLERVLQTTV